jgi:hypothetical protein
MNLRAISVVSWVLAASLSFLYVAAVWSFLRAGAFFPSNTLEALVLSIQFVKLVAILSVKRLRTTKFTNILNVWAVDILAVPVLIGLTISYGNHSFISLAGEVFLSWASAVLLVFPVFAIYKVFAMVKRNASLATVLPSATFIFALLVFFLAATTQSVPYSGLSGLARVIPSAIRDTSITSSPEVSVTGALLYLGLITYAVTQWREGVTSCQLDSTLIILLMGTVAALGWAYLAQLLDNALLDFGIPSLVIVTIVWLVARGE